MADDSKTVLIVMPLSPHPDGNGSQKRAAAHLTAFVATCNVHLVILDARNEGGGKSGDDRLLSQCRSVSFVKYRWRSRPHLLSLPPFPTISELLSPTIRRRLPLPDEVHAAFANVVSQNFDVVFCFKLISATIFDYAQSILPLKFSRRIVDFDDIQSLADLRAMAYERHGREQSIIDSLVRRQIRRAEDSCLRNYDAVWICSDNDKRQLELRRPRAIIEVIPNSVALVTPGAQPVDGPTLRLLFVGTLSYGPNEDGIVWFCREVLPLIKDNSTVKVVLSIVGFNPPNSVKALAITDEVIVTGGVDSVSPYYHDCDIVIAPIRYGGGTRLKILEAMSHQRPVISTTLGVEGIDAVSGESIMIGDNPAEFSRACLSLIADPRLRSTVGERGRNLVENKYAASVILAKTKQAI